MDSSVLTELTAAVSNTVVTDVNALTARGRDYWGVGGVPGRAVRPTSRDEERHITRLARAGHPNSEIGAQLFISAHRRVAPGPHLRQAGCRIPPRMAQHHFAIGVLWVARSAAIPAHLLGVLVEQAQRLA
jgi:hypothetical protein